MDFNSFYTGNEFEAYKYLGAHLDDEKCTFRVFAPMASRVELVIGDDSIEMQSVYDGNFYEVEVYNAYDGLKYEYRIYDINNNPTIHIDPYGFGLELRPNHKSIVRKLNAYWFEDSKWMKGCNERFNEPLNIYEIHAGSWKKPGEKEEDWYNYIDLAKLLIPYLKDNNYNYVEFMPLCEYPSDASWGYQNTGYFSPTSRFGTAIQLKEAIDMLHNNGIGAILDFVPAHFALDDYGLKRFDGSNLYEYPSDDVGYSEWGSCNFMHSRPEVRSFLQSSVNYWLQEFHFDGIRMDAISRIIYWQGDEHRGENGSAIDFIKNMNQGLKERNHGVILIAEDSTNFPNVTKAVEDGGLGFDYKWALGWMHDTLSYMQSPAKYRKDMYHNLTFSMLYFKNEKYLLPLSHDEVVHGKATILQKMSGAYEEKFAQAKALYMYMMAHPGKKLNFMGNEIGQLREWDERREQDWNILKYPAHDSFHNYMIKLNELYIRHNALWKWDYDERGFKWLDCHSESKCLYSFIRISDDECIAVAFNFSDKKCKSYSIDIPDIKTAEILLYTDWQMYGGITKEDEVIYKITKNKISLKMAPYSGVLFRII